MRRRRRGGRAIDPRLSRVTKGPGNPRGSPGWVLGLINARIPAPERAGQRSFACISSGITTVIRVTCGAIKGTITDLMSHSQFHCTVRVHLDLHGLIFETSICYWQDQPGCERQPNPGGSRVRVGPLRLAPVVSRGVEARPRSLFRLGGVAPTRVGPSVGDNEEMSFSPGPGALPGSFGVVRKPRDELTHPRRTPSAPDLQRSCRADWLT